MEEKKCFKFFLIRLKKNLYYRVGQFGHIMINLTGYKHSYFLTEVRISLRCRYFQLIIVISK